MEKANNKNGLYCLQEDKYRVQHSSRARNKKLINVKNSSEQQLPLGQGLSIWDANRDGIEEKQESLKKNYKKQFQLYFQSHKQSKRAHKNKLLQDSRLEQEKGQIAAQEEADQLTREKQLLKQKKRLQFQMLKEQQSNNFWV